MDVLTDIPPPSRFFQDEIQNFAEPSPTLPKPILILNPKHELNRLLVVALSAPALAAVNRITNKTLAGTLILPEVPLSGATLVPSPNDRSCQIYSVDLRAPSPAAAIIVAVQTPVADERAVAVAKSVLGGVRADKVLILDSIRSDNYRGRLGVDETLAFKVETLEERRSVDRLVSRLEYLPSGSVMDGLGAAVLGECQMRGIEGTLVGTWPTSGWASSGSTRKIISMIRELGIDVTESGVEDELASSGYDSYLYT